MASVAFNSENISAVVDITGFRDRGIITNALQANSGDTASVILEYLDDPDKFRQRYGWDESAFSSGRDGEQTPSAGNTGPSFVIHPPDDNAIIYGAEPDYYASGAPSRPPSRANNRSPMSRLVDVTASEFTTDAPSNRQEEEDHLQRAINESLHASGVQSPQPIPLPPPPAQPLPQQSGVSSTGDGSVQFGPANRPDYNPDEWAMVRVKNHESDPVPAHRIRRPGVPALLRCRGDLSWSQHRIGALLMIYQQIPAARNALLQTGDHPGAGYGNKSDWWKGEAITVSDQLSQPGGWDTGSNPLWTDELHRLMAFLEATERSYGTADALSRTRHTTTMETSDQEKDFFQSFRDLHSEAGTTEFMRSLISSVEVVVFDDLAAQADDCFGLLDLQVSKDMRPVPETLYDVLDLVFMADPRQAREDSSSARMAWIVKPSDIITCRFQGDDGLPKPIEIPETLYIDRYMKTNGPAIQTLQRDMITLYKAFDVSAQNEKSLVGWVDPRTDKLYDRRAITKSAARHCQDKIRKIRNRAFWREHEQNPASGEGGYYLPEHGGEPSLQPDEARVVAHYEAKIRELEERLAEIGRVMDDTILPTRKTLHELSRKMAALLTVPSDDEKWNPTHTYTLRGVANQPNTVFQRMRAPPAEQEVTPGDGAHTPGEDGWWKISYSAEGDAVIYAPVTFETVMAEACGVGSLPMLVYATDKALEQERLPLSDALASFVKLDNRLFKQELSQSDRHGHSPDRKRSAVLGADSQSKRRQRSNSMDSMASNQASAGDLDDDMRDAPFDNDSLFGPVGDLAAERMSHDDTAGLVHLPPQAEEPDLPPPYEDDVVMDADGGLALGPESARLAQVSLSSSPPRGVEMQERQYPAFLTRPNNSVAGNGTVVEPTVGHDKDTKFVPQTNGI